MKVPYTIFDETKDIELVTYTNGKEDSPPKTTWDDELWIERGEDWYALEYYRRKGKTVRVITREDWLRTL
jgi:long-subunit acyl-CoA synthetase (AMP-forming)